MNRRTLLQTLFAGGAVAALNACRDAAQADAGPRAGSDPKVEALQAEWRSFLSPGATVPAPGDALKLTDAEWKSRLDAEQYGVLRHEGTERPGSSPLNREKRPGIYACAGCGLPLFTSAMKYDSGTGWPSFFTTIPGVFGTKKDFALMLPRTEYHCIRCGGHHGHVFNDGPPPTGERWCNNGVALTFIPKAA
jgi:peptide-methionine (R)-S-oxide reductase